MEAFNINFMGEVEKYPELYDYTLADYSRKDVTDRAWQEIAKEVKLSGLLTYHLIYFTNSMVYLCQYNHICFAIIIIMIVGIIIIHIIL